MYLLFLRIVEIGFWRFGWSGLKSVEDSCWEDFDEEWHIESSIKIAAVNRQVGVGSNSSHKKELSEKF